MASAAPAVQIVGGGPAGSMAALFARRAGAPVRIFEKSSFPRHKVCGEFLSPAIVSLLRRSGCEQDFLNLKPAVLREMRLHFGASVVSHRLPAPAFGLSRYAFDRLLLDHAVAAGAEVIREQRDTAADAADPSCPLIVSAGRTFLLHETSSKPEGASRDRLFGFKAHFTGSLNDAVELYFFENCYVGVSAIENGEINICGLAPERTLRSVGFQPDELLNRCASLRARVHPLTRSMDWLVTGPLVFSDSLRAAPQAPAFYPAGDALGFIDPFTGSGILNAMLTGELAGRAAAGRTLPEEYLRECRRLLRRPFFVSRVMRVALASGHAGMLAPLIPGSVLFYATRPAGVFAA